MRNKSRLAAIFAVLIILNGLSSWAQSAIPLNRIGVLKGSPKAEFVDTVTGLYFFPEGNNYIKVQSCSIQGDPCLHSTFNIGLYDSSLAESTLSQMQHDGYKVVRVFIAAGPNGGLDTNGNYGVAGPFSTNVPDLYAPYMDNFIDFLRRANAHKIYVIPVLFGVPFNTYYTNLKNTNVPANVDPNSVNVLFLSSNAILAKRTYVRQFINSITAADSNLLSTIFAYELDNELFADSNAAPFSLTAGTVSTADGVTYDMSLSNPASRQQCQDANQVNYANQVAAEIHALDPSAMVSISVFTFKAVGKSGPNGLVPPGGTDPRFPARPLVLSTWANGLAYTDIHLYPSSTSYSIDSDLSSSEFSSIDLTKSPALMGEFGANQFVFSNITSAAFGMRDHRQNAYNHGFSGSLLWSWDIPRTAAMPFFPAVESNGAVNGQLAPIVRPTASATFQSNFPYLATDGNTGTMWNAGNFAPQWIQLDLGRNFMVSQVTLVVSQSPAGHTTHSVYGGQSSGSLNLLGVLDGNTQDGQTLQLNFPAQSLRYIKVSTTASPSWVAWFEITVR